ncbi:MAG: glycerophosphodiester phosphodiesterase [Methylococcaceae bacterium]|nr:glycerophosphodiester phosphodiesterase [Methylococcaceae bacterium]
MKTRQSKLCQIYAHRGARTEAADNTRLAFDKALMYAIDGIETDVQLTQDEVSVLWHDHFLDKLGYPGKRIDDFNYEQLKQINFAAYFNGAEAEVVLCLQEFVDQYRDRCKLQIEIKNRDWEDTQRHQLKMQQCLQIIGSSKNWDVFISSFNLNCLQYANQLGTKIPLVLAFKDSDSLSEVKKNFNKNNFLAGACHPISTLNTELVSFMRDHNKLIVTYTCNTQQEIKKALSLEVDILITDDPAKALLLRD